MTKIDPPATAPRGQDMSNFLNELQDLINRHSMENPSDTPDYILAQYLQDCLDAFARATKQREAWYGRDNGPGPAPVPVEDKP